MGKKRIRRRVSIWLDFPMIDVLMGEGALKREFPGDLSYLVHPGI